jgi:hypothetical protein
MHNEKLILRAQEFSKVWKDANIDLADGQSDIGARFIKEFLAILGLQSNGKYNYPVKEGLLDYFKPGKIAIELANSFDVKYSDLLEVFAGSKRKLPKLFMLTDFRKITLLNCINGVRHVFFLTELDDNLYLFNVLLNDTAISDKSYNETLLSQRNQFESTAKQAQAESNFIEKIDQADIVPKLQPSSFDNSAHGYQKLREFAKNIFSKQLEK